MEIKGALEEKEFASGWERRRDHQQLRDQPCGRQAEGFSRSLPGPEAGGTIRSLRCRGARRNA